MPEIPNDAEHGRYLPGPPGTNGDFWVGDRVRIHTGTGSFDYNEVDAIVEAITITRDDDNGELIIIPEMKTIGTPIEPAAVMWRAVTDDDQPAYNGATNPLGMPGLYPIAWTCSGDGDEVPDDSACAGFPSEPTVGPLHTTAGQISDPPGGSSTGPYGHYLGFTFDGSGTIDYNGTFQVFGVPNAITCYVEILVDGAVVTTGTCLTVSPGACQVNLSDTAVAVNAGSVLTARFYTNLNSPGFYIDTPGGDPTAVDFRITGGGLLP